MKVIIYLISLVTLIILAFLLPTKEKKSNFLLRATIIILFLLTFSILISTIAYFCHIKASLWTFAISNLIISVILAIKLWKQKNIQKYEIKLRDIIFVVLSISIIAIIAIVNYKIPFQIKYATTDAASHCSAAIHFMENEEILVDSKTDTQQYFGFYSMMIGGYINEGIFFSLFRDIFELTDFYKLYIIFDLILLFISALVMYELILCLTKNKKIKYLSIIISLIYILSYPLNSILMGSVYLTLVLIFITGMILIFALKDKIKDSYFKCMLFLLNIGIVQTYTIFAIIFIAEIIYLIVKEKKKSIFTIIVCVIIPGLSAVTYITSQVDIAVGLLDTEGPMYKNYYSNILIYIPWIIYAIYQNFKNKNSGIENYLFIFFTIMIPILTFMKTQEKISAYYYFKYYYVLWIIVITLAAKGMFLLIEKHFKIGIASSIIVITLLIISFIFIKTNYTDEELMTDVTKENPLYFSEMFKMNYYFIISNKVILNEEEIQLIKDAPNYFENNTENLKIISAYPQINWCYAIYNFTNYRSQIELINNINDINRADSKYLLVFKRASIMHQYSEELLQRYNYIYETKYGGVMQINEN